MTARWLRFRQFFENYGPVFSDVPCQSELSVISRKKKKTVSEGEASRIKGNWVPQNNGDQPFWQAA